MHGTRLGMTLIEALLAIFIATLAMEGFTLLFLRSWQQNAFIIETGVTAAANSRAVDRIVVDLRRASQAANGDYPIESADDNDLVFYADTDSNGTIERVHYYYQNGQILKGVREPTTGTPPTYASGDATTTVVAKAIVNTAADPVFEYYNQDYPGDTTNNPLATPAAIGSIRLVKVRLYMNIDPLQAPDYINVQSFAELRNLNDY